MYLIGNLLLRRRAKRLAAVLNSDIDFSHRNTTTATDAKLTVGTALKGHDGLGTSLAHKACAGDATIGESEQRRLVDDAAHGEGDDAVLGVGVA